MFTGIIEEVGIVESIDNGNLRIRAPLVTNDLVLGDSIAINGACLTTVSLHSNGFETKVVPETLRRTNLRNLKNGMSVNLELALRSNGRLGGHIVQGHVDDTGKVISDHVDGDAVIIKVQSPKRLMRYIVEKGFIAINGISLTVVDRFSSSFTTSVIPYTRNNTNLGSQKIGDLVNIEVDILSKYVESLLTTRFLAAGT